MKTAVKPESSTVNGIVIALLKALDDEPLPSGAEDWTAADRASEPSFTAATIAIEHSLRRAAGAAIEAGEDPFEAMDKIRRGLEASVLLAFDHVFHDLRDLTVKQVSK